MTDHDFGNCMILKIGFLIWWIFSDYFIAGFLNKTHDDSGNTNFELCFETDDLNEVAEGLEKYDIRYLHKMINERWGQKTIRFYDLWNGLIEIGEMMFCLSTDEKWLNDDWRNKWKDKHIKRND